MSRGLLLFISFLAYSLQGQDIVKPVMEFSVAGNRFSSPSQNEVTAVVVKSKKEGLFYAILGQDTLQIPRDADSGDFTYFLSLPGVSRNVQVLSANREYQLFLINSGSTDHQAMRRKLRTLEGTCEAIDVVDQADWRSGLAPPRYSRLFTDVKHTIIHHSAGSNTNTNYTQVVRDIYLFHTEVNGWSDIGYNYLIAQDGTIFLGRDPAGGDQLRVQGAHFCGRNSGTSGICMLGNYETANPSTLALSSLQTLLANSIYELGLDPLGTSLHPLGELNTISGHSDGCATLCPGQNVYDLLADIRQNAHGLITQCFEGTSLALEVEEVSIGRGATVRFFNQSNGYDSYTWIFQGGNPLLSYSLDDVFVSYYQEGVFDVTLIGKSQARTDTIIYEDLIQVSNEAVVPIIFPNPISSLDKMNIDFNQEIRKLKVFNLTGTVIRELDYPISESELLPKGLYLIEIISTQGTFTRKVIVQ